MANQLHENCMRNLFMYHYVTFQLDSPSACDPCRQWAASVETQVDEVLTALERNGHRNGDFVDLFGDETDEEHWNDPLVLALDVAGGD